MVYNAGSLNIDNVFSVPHIVNPGETLSSFNLVCYPGGKGLNQSVALARAGVSTSHIGCVGLDGKDLASLLEAEGVDVSAIAVNDEVTTGRAIIQVEEGGENAIVLASGANGQLGQTELDKLAGRAQTGDVLLLQNETNMTGEFISLAWDMGVNVALNPAPMAPEVADLPLERLRWLIVNEIEAVELVECLRHRGMQMGDKSSGDLQQRAFRALDTLHRLYPQAVIVLTRGKEGAMRIDEAHGFVRSVFPAPAPVVDTTAAGDTFIGYWLAGETAGMLPGESLLRACAAGALAVTRKGATSSIPHLSDVEALLSRV